MKKAVFSLTASQFLSTSALFYQDEGFFLLYGAKGTSYLFLYPQEVIKTHSWDELETKIDYNNTWVGFFSYEMACNIEPLMSIDQHPTDIPLCYFQRSGVECKFDLENQIVEVSILEHLHNVDFLLDEAFWKKNTLSSFKIESLELLSCEDKNTYYKKIEQAKEYIRSGDVYQVNLSHEFLFEASMDPFLFFHELIQRNPTEFAAFCHIKDCSILSISPELLLKKTKNKIHTRPIKGTRKRGLTKEEDNDLKTKLLSSPKERSELLMITDLMRNDLGRVALPKSVKVEDLFFIETYSTVHHLVSTISCLVAPSVHAVRILKNIFPGGSITGCPKIRAMEIINEIESKAREIYTGSIGFFEKGGDFSFNIAIRTLLKKGNFYSLKVGAGIVIDSDAVKEYEETIHKGRPFLDALGL